ncbi:carboxymuconolactone decarboxylase family protein [Brevundimonas sp. CEF1]|uniref:carboxymuconolactone decarboxylase family protein n=1 Tax=Brevundimonas sp. CEF1 TaxID=3442642 RepID=UPI003F512367
MTALMLTLCAMAAPAQAQQASATGAPPSRARQLMGDIAPKLAELTDDVLLGDVWERPGLAKRDRSLITVAALIALNRPDQLRSHIRLARQNGVTEEELAETITQLAFYAGWPNAITAVSVARDVFGEAGATSAQDITILQAGAEPASIGSSDSFTGRVRVEGRFQRAAPARIGRATVVFDAGAHTAWHAHPLDQTLLVTAGSGLVQQ